jgi:mono/diheme cytochrome c family protein
MRYFIITVSILFAASISFLGNRSDNFSRPPWQVFPDMDDQDKYLPQRASSFFDDGRADRPVPAGIVHRGNEIDIRNVFADDFSAEQFGDDPKTIALNTGLDTAGKPYQGFPIDVNEDNLSLGQEKYTLYCAVCHGVAGDGNGPTKAFKLIAANFFNPARVISAPGNPEGEIFKVLTEGVGGGVTGMVAFNDRLTPKERWAVILYIRALQKSRVSAANLSSLPIELANSLKNLNPEASTQP